jgi:hypothetical protein
MSFDVFISYSTLDLDRAAQVKGMLESAGAGVFLAEYSVLPSEALAPKIVEAIGDCDLFVLLWSVHARESEWVPQEIGIAKAADRAIMPVFLQENLELPGFLKGLKYLKLYKNPEEKLNWLREHVHEQVARREQSDGVFWIGVGAVLMWLLSGAGNDDVA